jgi:hypothetical protein
MTNAEKRERRTQAARKAAETRRQQLAAGTAPTALPPRVETLDEQLARRQQEAEKRLKNLRAVLARAREIRRESDLYHLAHTRRWHHSPKQWTSEQVDTARRFLEGFVRSDGTPQPDPIRRNGKWRL